MTAQGWKEILGTLVSGSDLTFDQAFWAMNEMMSGTASDSQIAGLVIGLRVKGETPQEVSGMVKAMLANAIEVNLDRIAVDVVGTGGDGAHTVNISTMATRANWQDQFPGLGGKVNSEGDDEDDDDDEDTKPQPAFEDNGSTTTVRLKVKTKLDGSISNAQQRISGFVKSVPATGRSQISQKGGLALTIINPEQYRDEVYRRIAVGAKHAATFYGPEYSLDVTGLDQAIAWKQVSNTEVFLYVPYNFSVKK